jgi:hypothetical protein
MANRAKAPSLRAQRLVLDALLSVADDAVVN